MNKQEEEQALKDMLAEFTVGGSAAQAQDPVMSPEEEAAATDQMMQEFVDMDRPKAFKEAIIREERGEPDPWSYTAVEMTANAMLFDWADEIAQATIAGLASTLTDDPRSAGQIMMDMEALRSKRQQEYAAANPNAALATQIVGAVASPANFIGGPAAVTARLAKLQGLTGTAARTAAVATRGAGEGALYAAGSAEAGEGVEAVGDGAIGGAGGAVVGKAALGGLGAVGGKLISRNIKGDLVDADGNFTPINMVEIDADSAVQDSIRGFYRDVIAPSFLGKTKMKAQQDRVINEATDIAEGSREALKASMKKQAEASKELDDFVKAEEAVLNAQLKAASKAGDDTIQASAKRAEEMLTQTGRYSQVLKTVKARLDSRLESQRVLFRTQAMDESLPSGVTPAERQKLFSMPVREQNDYLNELWNRHGFKVIKQQGYNLDLDKLTSRMSRVLQDEVALPSVTAKGALGEKGAADFAEEFRSLLSGRLQSGGYISGDDAAKVRSLIGTRRSSAFQGDNPDAYRAYTEMQNEFDNLLKSQLPKSAHKAWDADKAAYKTRLTFENASSKANNSTRDLLFTEDDWIGAVAFGDKKASRGVGDRLQQEAVALRTVSRSAEKKANAISGRYARKVGGAMEAEIARVKGATDKRITELARSIEADRAKLRTDSAAAERVARATEEIKPLQRAADEAESNLEMLRGLRSPEKPSWFHTLAATGILASIPQLLTGVPNLAIGAALGRPLSSESAQLLIAGQTRAQAAARNAVQKAQQSMIPKVQEGTLGMLSQGNSAGQTLRAIDRAQRAAAARAGMLTNQ